MKIKTLFSTIVFLFILFLSASVCFATNENSNMMQDMQGMVNNASNTVENFATNVGNTAMQGAENLGNTISSVGDDITGATNMNNNYTSNDYTSYTDNNNGYTAQRTAATVNTNNNFLGINSAMWTWLIMGIVGAIIIALVWYYAKEREDYSTNNHDNY